MENFQFKLFKNSLFLILFSLLSVSVFAQEDAENSNAVGHDYQYSVQASAGLFNGTAPNYTGQLNAKPNLLSIATYTLDSLKVGDIGFASNGGMYEVISIPTPGATPTVAVKLLNDPLGLNIAVPPSGDMTFARPTDECGLVPAYVADGGANGGISFPLATMVGNYNAIRSDACIGAVADSVEQVAEQVEVIETQVEENKFEIIQIKGREDLVNDPDSIVGNEYVEEVELDGDTLKVTDGGGTKSTDLSPLKYDDTVVKSDIAANAAGVAGNTSEIQSNDTEIAANAAGVAGNTSEIQSNDTEIAANAAGVAGNTSEIQSNDTEIAANAAGVAGNTSEIQSNDTEIAANAAGVAGNTSEIQANDVELQDHQNRLDAIMPDSTWREGDVFYHRNIYGDITSTNVKFTKKWYDVGLKTIRIYASSNPSAWITEVNTGTYNIVVPDGECVDRIGYTANTSGGSANISGGAITFNITTVSGSTSTLDGAVPSFYGVDANTGQVKVPTGALASTNSAMTSFSNGVLSATMTGFPGAFPNGSKMTVFNLTNE